jgi:hypothetical protein
MNAQRYLPRFEAAPARQRNNIIVLAARQVATIPARPSFAYTSLRFESSVDRLELSVDCLELSVDVFEQSRLHLVPARSCLGF